MEHGRRWSRPRREQQGHGHFLSSKGNAMTNTRWHALIVAVILAAAAPSAQGQMLWFDIFGAEGLPGFDSVGRDVEVGDCPPAIRRTIRQRFKNARLLKVMLQEAGSVELPDGSTAETLDGCFVLVETNGLRYVHIIDHTGAITDKGLAPVKEDAFKLADAPPLIQEAVRQKADGADVTEANVSMGVFRGAKFERAVFCVLLKLDGERWSILLDADGTVLDMMGPQITGAMP